MPVDCKGCAGCYIDWRDIAPAGVDLAHERHDRIVPFDEAYNLVPLTSDEVRAFLRSGLGDALMPCLFAADGSAAYDEEARGKADGETDRDDDLEFSVDRWDLSAIDGRPALYVGFRTTPKPVDPFGTNLSWLPVCALLESETLLFRLHDYDRYSETCATYPSDNLALGLETECQRVEAPMATNGSSTTASATAMPPLGGVGALGPTVFAHQAPRRLAGRVKRVAAGESTAADRVEFVAVAASSPGSLAVNEGDFEVARERVRVADS